ncbi:MAG: glycosyltransferase, partial [Muribaculaceae bacterium]|nr:glycosyltransferase [Muribaculaceae bacterium]
IKLYHNTGEKGINYNFENAISHAKGDIIFLADQDDVWNEGKIESCKNALKEYDCIVHDCVVTDSILHPTSPSLLGLIDGKSGFCHNIIRNGFTGCCMCFKKEMTKHFMPFPKKVDFFYDQWIGLRIEMKGKTLFLRKALMNFRRHDNTSSSASGRSRRSILKQISSRLSLITNLFLFDLKAHS